MNVNRHEILTLGALRSAGYQTRTIKEEMRANLIRKIKTNDNAFPGIQGYDESVIPDIQRAILSRHNMILLGLRGQAKTRIARQLVNLLDEYMPIVAGSEINDDPLAPLSRYAKDAVQEAGDETPIEWVHRSERYAEKLATPDVSVADLIGDVDPIKAAALKLPYSDDRVLHFGLAPRAHRSIFVINELPDLQARIQVALFNILQEGDIQIRGFKLRMPLDIQFVFTANPEDYTNRGSIVTPLKDRIDSQILTHYPKTLAISRAITEQEADILPEQSSVVNVNDVTRDLIEQIAHEARESEYIDPNSGVSARLTITAYENLISSVERRALYNNESSAFVRVADFWGVIPAITGKVELVYEGEQEGPAKVAQILIGKAIRNQFPLYFPPPDKFKRDATNNPYRSVIEWFGKGSTIDILNDCAQRDYVEAVKAPSGLVKLVRQYYPDLSEAEQLFMMEFVLHGLAEYSLLSKHPLETGARFSDLFRSMFTMSDQADAEDEL